MIRQTSPFMAGSPHHVESHGNRFIKPCLARALVAPTKGGNLQDPKETSPNKGREGVINKNRINLKAARLFHARPAGAGMASLAGLNWVKAPAGTRLRALGGPHRPSRWV